MMPRDGNVFFYGESPAMAELHKRVELVASSEVPVLISGETGTGKSALAAEIHRQSRRAAGPYVAINCAAIPAALMEAELFGYERGAFTGAFVRRKGKFEMANTGSIFLDEIADLDLSLQPKLLQVLQDGTLGVIGGSFDLTTDVRVMCSSNRDLESEVQKGQFRQDLYYRINVFHLKLPPLRTRVKDLPGLVQHFLGIYQESFNKEAKRPSRTLMDLFAAYSWPGNMRELENLIKQYVIVGDEGELIRKLQSCLRTELEEVTLPDGSISLKKYVRAIAQERERELILKVLRHNRWNRKKAARMLRISYRALLYKLKDCNFEQSAGASIGD